MRKIPRINLYFWIMKICATTLGETAGDLLSMTMKVGYATSSLILFSIFLMTFAGQLMVKTYHPLLFWAVILSTSTAGTTMSDYLDRSLGLGYLKGSLILATLLLATLAFWRKLEGSLSVDAIKTRRAEFLYWMAILFSNTLGTALGDCLADNSGLGFAGGALVVAALLAALLAAYYFSPISRVALFWAAFVLTRPFGATLGDILTKPREKGGLDFGTIGSSAVLAAVLISVILYTTLKESRQQKAAVMASGDGGRKPGV